MPKNQLPTVDNTYNIDKPLPLLVAKKWDFPLAYAISDDTQYYAIADWLRGLLSRQDVRQVWNDIQRKRSIPQLSDSIRHLPYQASDGKTYQVDYATARGLYLIAQHLRVTKTRTALATIKQFLADAGVFTDEVRRNPSSVVLSGAVTPDQAIDAAIDAYRAQGKDDRWIQARIDGKIKRNLFTQALNEAVAQVLKQQHFAIATNDIYRGLWDRTAANLKKELGLRKNDNLRDHQPQLALHYQGIAEEVSAHKLGNRNELTWSKAREIVKTIAVFIGKQAKETSQMLNMDIATGRPLLSK